MHPVLCQIGGLRQMLLSKGCFQNRPLRGRKPKTVEETRFEAPNGMLMGQEIAL